MKITVDNWSLTNMSWSFLSKSKGEKLIEAEKRKNVDTGKTKKLLNRQNCCADKIVVDVKIVVDESVCC